MQEDPQEIENGSAPIVEDKLLPGLYSKKMILVFSMLFSTIFSAFLLMSNLREVDKRKARLQVLLFAILYLFATAALIQWFQLPPNLSFVANVLGAAILNEYFWNKHIGKDQEFEKKKWMKPALISLLITVPLFLIVISAS